MIHPNLLETAFNPWSPALYNFVFNVGLVQRIMVLEEKCRLMESYGAGAQSRNRATERIRYGKELHGDEYPEICPDCGTAKGEYHNPGCDVEQCEFCSGQRISCECHSDD